MPSGKQVRRLLREVAQTRMSEIPEMLRYIARTPRIFAGKVERTCPTCGYVGRFAAFGGSNRPEAMCPKCKSVERHRLLYLALTRNGNQLAGKDVLHFAPEPFVRTFLASDAKTYVTADLFTGGVDLALDITDTKLPDGSLDVVICNHVLEHVRNDRAALAEFYRMLRSPGVAYVTVPQALGWRDSFEDDSIHTEEERVRHFGQSDHVRWYGRDFETRLTEAGFHVEQFQPPFHDYAKYGLSVGDFVFVARK